MLQHSPNAEPLQNCPKTDPGREVRVMAKLINCECGYVARDDTEDGVIALITDHMRADHPELVGKVTREDLRGWIEEE